MTRREQQNMHQHREELAAILLCDDLILEWKTSETEFSEVSLRLQQETFRRFNTDPGNWLFYLGFTPATVPLPESLAFWRRVATAYAKQLALTPELERKRHRIEVAVSDDTTAALCGNAPLFQGEEHLNPARLAGIWGLMTDSFRNIIREYKGTVEDFFHELRPDLELAGRVFFHLVENKKGASSPFAFLATYSTSSDGEESTRHVPLRNALREYEDDKKKLLELLATVYRAAGKSPLITSLLESGRIFHPLSLSAQDALALLKEVPLYEEAGICCRIPNWWTARSARLSISVSLGDKKPSSVGFDALISCVPRICAGNSEISLEEAERLLNETQSLVLIKNKWVEVDRDQLQKAIDAYAHAQTLLAEGLSMREAMRLMLNPESVLGSTDTNTDVTLGEWFSGVAAKLVNPRLIQETTPDPEFSAELRPYQQHGLNWLGFLDSLNFGPCLADDMGLGKTIQVLAFLSVIRKKHNNPSLLVLPASLIGNWQDEIDHFFPALKVLTVHASVGGKETFRDKPEKIESWDLLITTYGMVQRIDWLQEQHWHYVILDEAQAIKNPGTLQSRTVKKLKSINRLILTGTPVENRLADLWSLFDFINPGLLGTKSEFKKVASDITKSEHGYERLRRVVNPYILRRLKTDRTVIDDLPDKVEMKTYASMTTKQILVYRSLVADVKRALEETDGIQRRGLILSSLLKFKQICNHPDQYSGSGSFSKDESGKFLRLQEICETVYSKRERILIFSQFREIIEPINRFLACVFDHEGLVLHGGIPVKRRQALVDTFQNSREYVPYMVLSVKAAGVGLNLTRANHVVHFDRWWNPAVENQATDRAFRIGQSRNVIVHKFVSKGTIEEKIDRMIQDKTELSEQIIAASGENWITEMSNEKLTELFSLSI